MGMLYIDRMIIKMPIGLIVIIMFICAFFSKHYVPKKASITYIEGVISRYDAEVKVNVSLRGGGTHVQSDYYIYIGDVKIRINANDYERFEGREYYWQNILYGKYAKVEILNTYNCIYSIEVEDGSYSYHDPISVEYYNRGMFPFCIIAPIAVICFLIILRYLFLEIFASDERRKLVFGDENYNPFK